MRAPASLTYRAPAALCASSAGMTRIKTATPGGEVPRRLGRPDAGTRAGETQIGRRPADRRQRPVGRSVEDRQHLERAGRAPRSGDRDHAAVAGKRARVAAALGGVGLVALRRRLVAQLKTHAVVAGPPVPLGQHQLECLRDLHAVVDELPLQDGARSDDEIRALLPAVRHRRATGRLDGTRGREVRLALRVTPARRDRERRGHGDGERCDRSRHLGRLHLRASSSGGGVIAVWKRRRPPSIRYTAIVLSVVSPYRSISKLPT